MKHPDHAFTLLEVLATLLILVLGMLSTVALVRFGVRVAQRSQIQATGLVTAQTVLIDRCPDGRAPGVADWTVSSASGTPGPAAAYSETIQGRVNGYFVRRSEASVAADAVDSRARWVSVEVEVWTGEDGEHVTALKARMLRRWLP
jgi:prepilin-type N-terminal cleavage/methylation domain-containing protein